MNLEEISQCPVCQGSTFGNSFSSTDYTTSGEVFHVKRCMKCGLAITSPRPPESTASRYYQSDQYISHKVQSTGLIESIYLIMRRLTGQWKYDLVKPFLNGGALLDYGCGTGSFLQHVQKNYPNVCGIEPSIEARKNSVHGLPVFSDLSELPTQTFDVITLWHVIEHVYALRQTIRNLKDRLSPEGAMFLAVPNHQSADATHYAESWAAYDVPRHLWHFTQESMAIFLQSEGLRLTRVIPMKLDAFYVSLLSERYANPKTPGLLRAVRAVWVALRSNLSARKQKNYSSLIFVAEK